MTRHIEDSVERVLRLADMVLAHGVSVTYPSIGAANSMRTLVRDLADALKQQIAVRSMGDMQVEALMKLASDCYAEITRRSLEAINGPKPPDAR